jgi:DNA-directed RNA polymerase specialized sigma24 family protein
MSKGECGDASTLPQTAAELFQLASLLMGNGATAVSLVEDTRQQAEVDPCQDPEAALATARRQVLVRAVERLQTTDPEGLRAPSGVAAQGGCVQDDDLSAAGVSHAQLAEWLAGAGRKELREWLGALSPAQRVIFVERAVLGEGSAETAAVLAAASASWTPDAVGQVYREALCSLANALAHAPGAHLAAPGVDNSVALG